MCDGPDFAAARPLAFTEAFELPEVVLVLGAADFFVFDGDDFFGTPLPLLVLPFAALFAIFFSALISLGCVMSEL